MSPNTSDLVFEANATLAYTTVISLYMIASAICMPVCLLARWTEEGYMRFMKLSYVACVLLSRVIFLPMNMAVANAPELFRPSMICSLDGLLKVMLICALLFQQTTILVFHTIY